MAAVDAAEPAPAKAEPVVEAIVEATAPATKAAPKKATVTPIAVNKAPTYSWFANLPDGISLGSVQTVATKTLLDEAKEVKTVNLQDNLIPNIVSEL